MFLIQLSSKTNLESNWNPEKLDKLTMSWENGFNCGIDSYNCWYWLKLDAFLSIILSNKVELYLGEFDIKKLWFMISSYIILLNMNTGLF